MSFATAQCARTGLPRRSRRAAVAVAVAVCLVSALLPMGGTPAGAANDTTAPTWGEVTVSPAEVDTSTEEAVVTVTARILDDQGGIIPGTHGIGGYGSLTFRTTTGSHAAYVSFTAADRISGTAQDGVYRDTITLRRYTARTTWVIESSSLCDSWDNTRYTWTVAESAAAGLTATFNQTSPGDTTAPVAARVTLSPTTIDTSDAAQQVTVRIRVTDDDAGIKPENDGYFGGAASVTLTGPPGTQSKTARFRYAQRVSGNHRDGTYETTVTIPEDSPQGTWRVTQITTQDNAGNHGGMGTAGVAEAGLDASFTDTSAPVPPTTTTTSTRPTTTTTRPTTTTTTRPTTATTTTPTSTTTTTMTKPATATTTAAPAPFHPGTSQSGYWMAAADGQVFTFGDAVHHGEPRGRLGGASAVDLEPSRGGKGYWVLDESGRVSAHGDARWYGNVDRSRLAAGERATSLSRTASGAGYWVFTSRGRVLPFGDAVSYGDVSTLTLAGPVLDSIATPSGKGYYMVASDGGIFAFGDARFHGSMGGATLNAPVQSLVPDGDGVGYWLVASDGGIFAFDAPFRGSMGGRPLNRPVSGMVRFGNGYLMVGEDGGIFNFSDRPFLGSLGATPPTRPVVAVAVRDR